MTREHKYYKINCYFCKLFIFAKVKFNPSLKLFLDNRCSEEFLRHLPVKSHNGLHSGFGMATLFWYINDEYSKTKNFLQLYDSSGTIQDYITYLYVFNFIKNGDIMFRLKKLKKVLVYSLILNDL